MKFLAFVSVFITTDTILMCLSGNISRSEVELMKNNQKTENESKHFSGQGKPGMDQESIAMTFEEITIMKIYYKRSVVNSNVTYFYFNDKQNVPKANEESNTVTKSWYSTNILLNFSNNRNLKNSDSVYSDINTSGTTYESSEFKALPAVEVENKISNTYFESKLLGITERQERSKSLDTYLSEETILQAIPEIWYEVVTQNFSCAIQQYEELSITCSNISMYEISVFLPTDTVTVDISNCHEMILLKPLFPQLKHLRSLKLTNNHH
ncbi:hypothetical protein X975_14640, partial [Stegodyphus mimosarum]